MKDEAIQNTRGQAIRSYRLQDSRREREYEKKDYTEDMMEDKTILKKGRQKDVK